MNKKRNREQLIRTVWKAEGRKLWNPGTHGKSRFPLILAVGIDATPIVDGDIPPPHDVLEFKLFPATGRGQAFNYIVCEGVIVETWDESGQPNFTS
jgi:hypothetical protein